MAAPLRYPRPPVELAGAVEAYLYDCTPGKGCGACAALVRELAEARAAKQWSAAYDAAAKVRNHPHGTRGFNPLHSQGD
ncbi:hypothetical protein DWB77_04631 [Streptomyces hundungensis]|uniref:Uncharacterized protein n=1 Tax=Streptomyces hundungensis TaxID=1077946 RepID=A0A387HF31_9ACTN|nr:hypothetical protein DWB77_04631 [Streptomyces hundungensis]